MGLQHPQERVGKRVHELRRLRRLTQEQLGERSGLSYKFIGEIERGKGNPTIVTLASLAHALGVDVPELFGTLEKERPVEEIYAISANDLSVVREALSAAAGVLKEVGSPTSLRRPPRPRRRSG